MLLRTARLDIRLPVAGDGARLASYYRENREFLQPYYPRFTKDDFDPAAWEATLPMMRSDFEARRACRSCLVHDDAVIGVINVTGISGPPRHAGTLGYSLAEAHQGCGLMTEALETLVPFVFSHFRIHRLEANYMPHNARSGRVLERVGFVKEGLARDYLLIDGEWRDHVLTARINEHWE